GAAAERGAGEPVRSGVPAPARAGDPAPAGAHPRRAAAADLRRGPGRLNRRHLRLLPAQQAGLGCRAHRTGSGLPGGRAVTRGLADPERRLVVRTRRLIMVQTAGAISLVLVLVGMLVYCATVTD